MEVRYDLRPADVKAAKLYVAKHISGWTRRTFLGLLLFALVHFAVIPAIVLIFAKWEKDFWWEVYLILQGQIICWVVFAVFLWKQLPKSPLKEGYDKDITLTIGPDWIRASNPLVESAHRWTDIDKIAVTDHHAFFFFETTKAYVLPRRAFADSARWFLFLEKARSYFEGANAVEESQHQKVT
jgi:hypothetical protein